MNRKLKVTVTVSICLCRICFAHRLVRTEHLLGLCNVLFIINVEIAKLSKKKHLYNMSAEISLVEYVVKEN